MTTFRADLVAGIGTMVNDYIAANPTLLARHFRFRPPSEVTDTPYSYLELRPESIAYDNSIRERIITADLVVLDRWTEGGETMDRVDILADALVTHMASYYHIVPSSWWSEVQVTDEQQEGRVGFRLRWEVHFLDGHQ